MIEKDPQVQVKIKRKDQQILWVEVLNIRGAVMGLSRWANKNIDAVKLIIKKLRVMFIRGKIVEEWAKLSWIQSI